MVTFQICRYPRKVWSIIALAKQPISINWLVCTLDGEHIFNGGTNKIRIFLIQQKFIRSINLNKEKNFNFITNEFCLTYLLKIESSKWMDLMKGNSIVHSL